jgi:phosphopantetheinyl transferase
VERADRDVGADRLALKFLTARERATLEGRDADERRRRFLHYWTCKEAMSKARRRSAAIRQPTSS